MISNKKITQEIEELKYILMVGDLDVPSMWSCLKPGLIISASLIVCTLLSYGISSHASDVDKTAAIVFSFFVGFLITAASANSRGIFLSVPYSFRRGSEVYAFFGKKIKSYAVVYAVVAGVLPFLAAEMKIGALGYIFPAFLWFFIVIVVMNIDFGRYQISMLTSTIEMFKDTKKITVE